MKELMSKMNDAKKELPIIKDALNEAKINILLIEKKHYHKTPTKF